MKTTIHNLYGQVDRNCYHPLMTHLEMWELASYIVTVIGLPLAIVVFMLEQKKERMNEDEETYQRLSDEYADFLIVLLKNADLKLMAKGSESMPLSEEQAERKRIIFDMLISLFERAFILVYEDKMSPQTKRLWSSWDDYIHDWCKRQDFRDSLQNLLLGEDPDFESYMRKVVAQYNK